MKINKRFLQFIAAIWILVFHLWIPVSSLTAEQYIVKIGYAGVDIFFFLSAYSLADKKLKYGPFILDRAVKIYLKFVLFIVAAALYMGFGITKALKVMAGIDFMERGGGSLLWFIPAIMIFYLVYPLFLKINNKYKTLIALVLWLIVTLILDKAVGYTKCFIFTNRIPVILAGYVLKTYPLKKWISIPCLPIGAALMYFWGFTYKLNMPFKEFYYILAIPLVIGLAGISSFIKSGKIMEILGSATLEIYALQMIVGPKLVSRIFKLVGGKLLTNLIVFVIILLASVLISLIYNFIVTRLQKVIARN